jgi:hypothetical protein
VLNIVQTFLNEPDLFTAVVELPKTMEFVSLVTKLATHPKFKYIECKCDTPVRALIDGVWKFSFSHSLTYLLTLANADYLVKNLPEIQKTVGSFFDVHQLFSNDRIFSNLGKILCGKPFPRSNNIRYVDNIFYTPDYNGADKDELDVMPSEYIFSTNVNLWECWG